MKTLLKVFRSLPVVSQRISKTKTKSKYYQVYGIQGLRRGLCIIDPKPSEKELSEAIDWLEKKGLSLPVGTGELDKLIKTC